MKPANAAPGASLGAAGQALLPHAHQHCATVVSAPDSVRTLA
jgi:hypothetical protein